MEFIAEVDRVLVRISHERSFATAPIATMPDGDIRREFVDRFPYVVVFVETSDLPEGDHDPARQLEPRAMAVAPVD